MKLTTTLLFSFIIFCTQLHAASYYVSSDGSDTNAGTDENPFLTIQKAADVVHSGDTVYIKQGTYTDPVELKSSGTVGKEIIFTNYAQDKVVINGAGKPVEAGIFEIYNHTHIIISNLRLINSSSAGFYIEKSKNITIRNCSTYNTFSSGIGIWESSHVTIDGNEIELACNDGSQECITIANSYNCEIRNNHVHHSGPGTNGGEGIDVKQGSHDIRVYKNRVHHLNKRIGIYADAWNTHTYNIDIFQNVVHHCGNCGFVVQTERGGLIENISIFNNISYYNKWDGIVVGSVTAGDDVPQTPVKNIKIINNTCYKNGAYDDGTGDNWGFGVLVDNPDAENILISNNICSKNNAQIAIQQISSNGVVDHNLIHGDNSVADALNGTNAVTGDPLFEDPENGNFHLKNISPGINSGINTEAPLFDFEGATRPINDLWDIGAYEVKNGQPFPLPFISLLMLGKNDHQESL